jgi:restriction endonuclease S subunit
MIMTTEKIHLKDIAEIKAGHPFRGKISEVSHGDASVIQIRDVDEHGLILWHKLIKTDISGRKMPDWLQQGDILFAARGYRNVAAYVDRSQANTVCAPHYFLIRLNTNIVEPAFIAWQLNQQPAQKYFAKYSQGSAVASIPRDFLATTPITLPTIAQQQKIVSLANTYIKEKQILQALINNRELQMEGVAKHLLNSS